MDEFDDDMPNGFRDADFEMRALEEAGNRDRYLQSIGKCPHGWSGPHGSEFECYNCGFIGPESAFPDRVRLNAYLLKRR